MIADPFFGTQNDIFNNPKTTDFKFLISWKFEVTIILRKSEGIKGLPNRYFTEPIALGAPDWYDVINKSFPKDGSVVLLWLSIARSILAMEILANTTAIFLPVAVPCDWR